MDTFTSNLLNLPPPFNMIVLVMLIIFGSMVIGHVVGEIRKYVSHRHELEFKRDLVQRGLSVEEIERIVAAGEDSDRINNA